MSQSEMVASQGKGDLFTMDLFLACQAVIGTHKRTDIKGDGDMTDNARPSDDQEQTTSQATQVSQTFEKRKEASVLLEPPGRTSMQHIDISPLHFILQISTFIRTIMCSVKFPCVWLLVKTEKINTPCDLEISLITERKLPINIHILLTIALLTIGKLEKSCLALDDYEQMNFIKMLFRSQKSMNNEDRYKKPDNMLISQT